RAAPGQPGKDNQASRRVFTSGEIEPVYDGTPGGNSPFTHEVVSYLENQDASFLCSKMEAHVIEQVSGSKPIRNILLDKKYTKGEFVFYPKETTAQKIEKAWQRALELDTEKAYDRFLEDFPNSPYEEEAEKKLEYAGEKRVWLDAKRKNTIAALRRFCSSHPKSPFIEEGREALALLRKREEIEAIDETPAPRITIKSDPPKPKKQEGPIEMIHVAGGSFKMAPGFRVKLSDYEIGKYPITQEEWTSIMGNNPSHFKGDKLPVEKVSWEDAQQFIRKINAKHPDMKYRLPTEAEWEFAARGGNQGKGYTYAGSNNLAEVGWYKHNANSRTRKVGQKKANELGIHDMSGNIWEWCEDRYSVYPTGEFENYTGPTKGSGRVYRGGSWYCYARVCQVSSRGYWSPGDRGSILGFRLSRTL
ncbi:MAG: SUMF1/EgtB/PvdO family nonheme iron enzyme, partial [Bacteroidota bacterium]